MQTSENARVWKSCRIDLPIQTVNRPTTRLERQNVNMMDYKTTILIQPKCITSGIMYDCLPTGCRD